MASPHGVRVTRADSVDHEGIIIIIIACACMVTSIILFTGKAHMKSRPSLKDLLKELVSVVEWQLLMINMRVEKFENDKREESPW